MEDEEDKYLISLAYSHTSYINAVNDGGEYSPVEVLFADINIQDYSEDVVEKAGHLELHYYNAQYAQYHGYNLFDTFDRDGDTVDLGLALLKKKTGLIKDRVLNELLFEDEIDELVLDHYNKLNFLVIYEMVLLPKFRGQGFGDIILNGLKEHYQGKAAFIFLKSLPMQHEAAIAREPGMLVDERQLIQFDQDEEVSQLRLNRFFMNNGFKELPSGENVFGFNMGVIWLKPED